MSFFSYPVIISRCIISQFFLNCPILSSFGIIYNYIWLSLLQYFFISRSRKTFHFFFEIILNYLYHLITVFSTVCVWKFNLSSSFDVIYLFMILDNQMMVNNQINSTIIHSSFFVQGMFNKMGFFICNTVKKLCYLHVINSANWTNKKSVAVAVIYSTWKFSIHQSMKWNEFQWIE